MITVTLPKGPGLYRITDSASGRFYIGSSVNVAKRWYQHQGRLRKGTHPNPMMQNIWNKDCARLSIALIQACARDGILACEQIALDAAGVGVNPLCMNVLTVAGSHLGRKRPPETIERLSVAQRGKTATPEAKAKMRAAKLGRTQTVEHRRNSGNARRGKPGTPRAGIARPTLRSLTTEQVLKLRVDRAAGMSWRLLAESVGRAKGTTKRIVTGATYKNLETA